MGTTASQFVGGGLMAGLGDALQERAKRENDDMMLMKKEAMESARQLQEQQFLAGQHSADLSERLQERQGEFQDRAAERKANEQERAGARADTIANETANRVDRANERQAERASRDNDIAYVEPDEGSNAVGVTRGGGTKQLGFKMAGKGAPPGPGETSAADERYIKEAKDFATPVDSLTGKPGATDYRKMAQHLYQRGRQDIAMTYLPPLPGSGTKQNPYVGEDQLDVDWFKQNANPGDVISVGGKNYSK